ncbi:uncharacterized protein J3R85_013686 [Psidium guajava]|nr:uncharacterized protein J3R85_013686 [Psidium guajava]
MLISRETSADQQGASSRGGGLGSGNGGRAWWLDSSTLGLADGARGLTERGRRVSIPGAKTLGTP